METWKILIDAIYEFYLSEPKKDYSLEEFLETMWKITTILPTAFSIAKEKGESYECRKKIGEIFLHLLETEGGKKFLVRS